MVKNNFLLVLLFISFFSLSPLKGKSQSFQIGPEYGNCTPLNLRSNEDDKFEGGGVIDAVALFFQQYPKPANAGIEHMAPFQFIIPPSQTELYFLSHRIDTEGGEDNKFNILDVSCGAYFDSYFDVILNNSSEVDRKRNYFYFDLNSNYGRFDVVDKVYDVVLGPNFQVNVVLDTEEKYEFCKISDNIFPGTVRLKEASDPLGPLNISTKEEFIAGEDGLAQIRIEWANLGYCSYMHSAKIVVFEKNGISSPVYETGFQQLNRLANEEPWDLPNRNSNVIRYSSINLTEGEYRIELMYKDALGYEYSKKIDEVYVRNQCYYDTPNFDEITPISDVDEIEGGYNGGDLGGYKLEAGIPYEFTFSGIQNFEDKYQLSLNYGDGDESIFNNNDVSLSYVSNGKYSVTINNPLTSVTIEPKPLVVCNDLGNINFFTGGQNQSFSSKCLINVPCDLNSVFPKLKAPVAQDQILRNFTYQITSTQGVVFDAEKCGGNGVVLEAGAILEVKVNPDIADEENQDSRINFIKNIVFNESGEVVGASKGYFDNNGESLQNQVKNVNDGYVMANEIFFDDHGREALLTLPSPIRGESISSQLEDCQTNIQTDANLFFQYQDDFVQTENQEKYSVIDYGVSGLVSPTPVSSEPNTFGHYFQNPQYYGETRAKTKYPFAQTIYREDGTGEVKYNVAPGDVYRKGGGYTNVGSTEFLKFNSDPLKNEFDESSTLELIKWTKAVELLTGASIPLVSLTDNVYLTERVDANGVISQTVSDRSGKILFSIHVETGDAAYYIYDDFGRLIHEISPLAVARYVVDVPETLKGYSSYEYNYAGFLLKATLEGEGITEFIYTKDGRVRFSQNSEQKARNSYSYINYDPQYRVVESGEYSYSSNEDDYSFSELDQLLYYSPDADGLVLGIKKDVVKTIYDLSVFEPLGDSSFDQSFTRGKVSTSEKVGVSKTWYNYDERGRIVSTLQFYEGLQKGFITEYEYNKYGSVGAVHFQKDIPSEAVSHYYNYDLNGRLVSSEVELTIEGEIKRNTIASYAYNLDGSIKSKKLDHAEQELDYQYTIEGWLKSVNAIAEVGNDPSKAFAMSLAYYKEDYNSDFTELETAIASSEDFSGNIGAMQWKSSLPDGLGTPDEPIYKYSYDKKYQLTDATWGSINNGVYTPSSNQAYHVSGLNYDANGNINDLDRTDDLGGIKHDLHFNYSGIDNQLTSVSNYSTYSYDNIGRLLTATKDGTDQYNYGYNSTGLLSQIQNNTTTITEVEFDYNEEYRIKKLNNIDNKITWYVRDLSGNLMAIYEGGVQKEVPLYGASREGIYRRSGNIYNYELKDHLGNVRVVINKTDDDAPTIETTKDYYPFGLVLRQAGVGYRYGYQGEFSEDETDETGFNSFQLRNYDPVIGRWMSPDPYGEFWSPYNGMGNNPITFTDPDGGKVSGWQRFKANVLGIGQIHGSGHSPASRAQQTYSGPVRSSGGAENNFTGFNDSPSRAYIPPSEFDGITPIGNGAEPGREFDRNQRTLTPPVFSVSFTPNTNISDANGRQQLQDAFNFFRDIQLSPRNRVTYGLTRNKIILVPRSGNNISGRNWTLRNGRVINANIITRRMVNNIRFVSAKTSLNRLGVDANKIERIADFWGNTNGVQIGVEVRFR